MTVMITIREEINIVMKQNIRVYSMYKNQMILTSINN